MKTQAALAAALALTILAAGAANAADKAEKTEKCFGVALAGKNDCAATGSNSCAGTSKVNADPRAWIYVPAGYCERIVNASLKPVRDFCEGV